ncbi:MAG: LysE family transporter [Chloroflexi bacterium]|nr:LysE family transporter [Chloroflexota bacterium]
MELIAIVAAFWVISLSGALSPGPLTALAISEGARAGFWSGPKLALGHGLIEGALVLAIAYGLGSWLQQPVVAGTIGLAGGVLLLWMGYGLVAGVWRGHLSLQDAHAASPPSAVRLGQVPAGVLMSVGNPYWSLWWATFGASQILRVAPYGLWALAFFYVVGHWTADLGWLSLLSMATASGRRVISDRVYRITLVVCGLFLIAFAVYFGWSGWGFLARAMSR